MLLLNGHPDISLITLDILPFSPTTTASPLHSLRLARRSWQSSRTYLLPLRWHLSVVIPAKRLRHLRKLHDAALSTLPHPSPRCRLPCPVAAALSLRTRKRL